MESNLWRRGPSGHQSRSAAPVDATSTFEEPELHRVSIYATKAQVPYRRDDDFPTFKGAQGVVYRANLSSGLYGSRAFAVKEIHLRGAEERTKLENEIKHLRKCNHPNVLRLHEAFRIEDDAWTNTYFLVTEPWAEASFDRFLTELGSSRDGKSSSCTWYVPGKLAPWPSVVGQCISGLQHLHENSIKHKDLKPANILLLDGSSDDMENPKVKVIIADLGISKASTLGAPTSFDGTKQYMAPEQLAAKSSTTQSDIFSLGTCFAMIQAVLCTEAGVKHWMKAKQRQEKFFAVDKFAESRFADNIHTILALLDQLREEEQARAEPAKSLFHQALHNMVQEMFTVDPLQRPNADILLDMFETYETKARPRIKRKVLDICFSLGRRTTLQEVDISAITTDRALYDLLDSYIKRSYPKILRIPLSYLYKTYDIQYAQFSMTDGVIQVLDELDPTLPVKSCTGTVHEYDFPSPNFPFIIYPLISSLRYAKYIQGSIILHYLPKRLETVSPEEDPATVNKSQVSPMAGSKLSNTTFWGVHVVQRFNPDLLSNSASALLAFLLVAALREIYDSIKMDLQSAFPIELLLFSLLTLSLSFSWSYYQRGFIAREDRLIDHFRGLAAGLAWGEQGRDPWGGRTDKTIAKKG